MSVRRQRGNSKIAIHQGQALVKIAATYGNVMAVILEQVQNSIDADARNILVDISIGRTGTIIIQDDGHGVDEAMFGKALSSIFMSIKSPGKLGRFGIGLVSAIGKCDQFTFTSCHESGTIYREWTLNSKELSQKQELSTIPWITRDLVYSPSDQSTRSVPWRTEVRLQRYGNQRTFRTFSLERLRAEIVTRYNQAMSSKDWPVAITIRYKPSPKEEVQRLVITPSAFPGHKLPEKDYGNDQNQTHFQIYVTNKHDGQVLLSATGDHFTLPFESIIKSEIVKAILPSEMIEGMMSGLFAGLITNSKIKPTTDRNGFEEETDNAILELCHHLSRWWKEIGADHLKEYKKFQQDNRYQNLGDQAIKSLLDAIQKNHKLASMFRELMKKKPSSGTPTDQNQGESKTTKSEVEPNTKKEDSGSAPNPKRNSGQTNASSDFPVSSPHFSFVHKMAEGEPWLWQEHLSSGTIAINIKHPIWMSIDAPGKSPRLRDHALIRLQINIGIHAILVVSEESHVQKEYLRNVLEHQMEIMSYFLRNDDECVKNTTIHR